MPSVADAEVTSRNAGRAGQYRRTTLSGAAHDLCVAQRATSTSAAIDIRLKQREKVGRRIGSGERHTGEARRTLARVSTA